MKSVKVKLPVFIISGVRKIRKDYLNLNNYHTWHFQHRNKLKKLFQDNIAPQIYKYIPRDINIISLKYTIYHKTNRKFDICNKLVLLDKYFQDTLVELKIIKDDNYEYIKHIELCYGGKKDEDYAEVTIFFE